jgi:hypothetical protein
MCPSGHAPFGPVHVHWISGSKLFGGAAWLQSPIASMLSCTLHRSTGGPVVLSLVLSVVVPVVVSSVVVSPVVVVGITGASVVDPVVGPVASPDIPPPVVVVAGSSVVLTVTAPVT